MHTQCYVSKLSNSVTYIDEFIAHYTERIIKDMHTTKRQHDLLNREESKTRISTDKVHPQGGFVKNTNRSDTIAESHELTVKRLNDSYVSHSVN